MDIGGDQKDVEFISCDATPGLCHRNPEQLLRIVFEARQRLFDAMPFDPSGVCPICFFDATIVGDIFTLCVDSIQLKVDEKSRQYEKSKLNEKSSYSCFNCLILFLP